MSQDDSPASPPAPMTDHSHMFDDLPDEPSTSQPMISLTPVRKSTNTLFLGSPDGSEGPDVRGSPSRTNGDNATGGPIFSDEEPEEPEERPSKKQRSIQAPASTANGRAPPRTANGSTAVNDPFADLEDLDYTRRAPARFDGDGMDSEDDRRNAQTQSRDNVVQGGDYLDAMNTRRARANFGDEEGDAEPVLKVRRVLPKLDADRLLSERGLPKLVEQARKFKIKGKGHEAADLGNLLTMYQFWAHQMFPKSTFGEATGRVETLCHSKLMKNAMNKYYEEERLAREALLRSPSPLNFPEEVDATEIDLRNTANRATEALPAAEDQEREAEDDDMDLDALIAQAEAEAMATGGGDTKRAPAEREDDTWTMNNEDEDEDAMRAMELDMEMDAAGSPAPASNNAAKVDEGGTRGKTSLWGGNGDDADEEDWEALDAMES